MNNQFGTEPLRPRQIGKKDDEGCMTVSGVDPLTEKDESWDRQGVWHFRKFRTKGYMRALVGSESGFW